MHVSKLWPCLQALRTLEQSTFGAYLHAYGSETKGAKLLARDRFKWAAQGPRFEPASRRKHAFKFLHGASSGRSPRRDEFTAFGQASVEFAEEVFRLLQSHDARVFASIVPRGSKPKGPEPDLLRRNHTYLFERDFYFLEHERQHGLLVMDETDQSGDRDFVRRLERYFTSTLPGRQRTQWIVPVPLFVKSEMAYGVQVADLCVYCLNWGYRKAGMTDVTRPAIEPLAWWLERQVWQGDGYRDSRVFRTYGVCYLADPYR